MFNGAGLSTENYDSLLTGWASLSPALSNSESITFGSSQYCTGLAGKIILNTTHSWTITDGGMNASCPVAPSITPPVILNATSADNYTTDNLTGHATATDYNGDNITYAYNWYKNGELNATSLITDGLVAYYPLNNDTLDYWGSNDGNSLGPDNATLNTSGGKIGGAYEFDGIDDYIIIPDDPSLDLNGTELTISLWIKPDEISGTRMISKEGPLGSRGWLISTTADLKFAWSAGGQGGTTTTNGVLTEGAWNMITAVYDNSGTLDGIDLYHNGVFVSTTNWGTMPAYLGTNDYNLLLGSKEYNGINTWWNGSMDEFLIYNRSLSETEIQQLYYAGLAGGHTMHSNNTGAAGENWTLGVKAADYQDWSDEVNSSNVTIQEAPGITWPTNWTTFQGNNNLTGWDGNNFTVIPGLNYVKNTNIGGIYSSPIVINGLVYVGSADSNLYKLNASNISQIVDQTGLGNPVGSPVLVNGYVYVGTQNRIVHQVNASNFSQKIGEYDLGGSVACYPQIAVANGYVYAGCTGNRLYQLDADNVSISIASYLTGGDIYGTPKITSKYVYIPSDDGYLYQLNASDVSQQIANFSVGGMYSPVLEDGYIYAGGGFIRKLNASNISILVDTYNPSYEGEGPISVVGNYVYVGMHEKYVQISKATMNPASQFIIDDGYGQRAGVTISGSYAYFPSYNNGTIYQVTATSISSKIAERYTGGSTTSSPAVANGYVYVGSATGFYQMNTSNISLGNYAPNTISVVLNSTTGSDYSNESINCYANITDLDEDDVYASIKWYKNGVEQATLNEQSGPFTQATINLLSTVLSGNTSAGENWTCSVQAYADYTEDDWLNSSNITIVETPGPPPEPWPMFQKDNNLSGWDGNNFTVIPGQNLATVDLGSWEIVSPAVVGGSVYTGLQVI